MTRKLLLAIAVSTAALGLDLGGRWTTPAFAFASLLQGSDKYGHDILKGRDVANAARRLLGADYKRFSEILDVSPPVKVVDGRYVFGQGCQAHNCVDSGALIVVDTQTRKVWAAMTDGAVKKAWPGPMSRWPANIRQIVKSSYE